MRQFEWDYRNRLVAVVDKDAAGNEAQRVEFTYDAIDRRISKLVNTEPANSGQVEITSFIYNGQDIHLEFKNDNELGVVNLRQRYLHGPGIDQILAQEDVDGALWHLADHLGTVRDIVASDGTLENHLIYDSSGKVIFETNPEIDSRYLFTEREFDNEIDLYYYRNRYYDSDIGRFLSEDPIGFASGDFNQYRYTFNSPVNLRDPSGEFTIGGSFYYGVGGGFSFTFDPFNLRKGIQLCGEFGVGIGGGLDLDLTSKVGNPSIAAFGEAGLSAGIASVGVGAELGIEIPDSGCSSTPQTSGKVGGGLSNCYTWYSSPVRSRC